MWGIILAAGLGSRIQPLAFSKGLLPVGSHPDGNGERPRAVSEYLIERMARAGADNICFVIAPGKSDSMEYYGSQVESAYLCYVVQPSAAGLCDSISRALQVIPRHDHVVIGLPDTIWFSENALCALEDGALSFLLFPVQRPELFDVVVTDDGGAVREIQVKNLHPESSWIWGAFKMPDAVL